MRTQVLFVLVAVFLLRLPFLNEAIQGDDVYYLAGAEHAQIDPLHPHSARYPLQGKIVDMRGHPHGPLNAWCLGALLALAGTVSEIPYHAAYIVFSIVAALSALSIARRLTPQPLAATLLFLAVPAFVVNGNSLEADVPFLAFWLASIAIFLAGIDRRSSLLLAVSVLPMALAALAAYQAIFLALILWVYVWEKDPDWKLAWAVPLTGPLALGAWQLGERLSTGGLPATVLAGYMHAYGLQALAQKLKNAVALTAHLGWVVFLPLPAAAFANRRAVWLTPLVIAAAFYDPNPLFWLSVSAGQLILLWCLLHFRDFTAAWVLIFFICALVIFFAGSSRYLLPLALPVAILVSRNLKPRWLYAGAAAEFVLSLALAFVNYQHWDGYRKIAQNLEKDVAAKRVWINGEWGLRFYLEREGALPLMRGQTVPPGDLVVTSRLAFPLPVAPAGGVLAEVMRTQITSAFPLRLVALKGKSAYSTTLFGLRPFDISTEPIDEVKAEIVVERKPILSYLPMNAPEAEQQIVSGIYALESNAWRWMSMRALVLLKPPATPAPIEVIFTIPPASPTREMSVFVDNQIAAKKVYDQPGAYSITTTPIITGGDSVVVTIMANKTFSSAGDTRELSVILSAVGFQSPTAREAITH